MLEIPSLLNGLSDRMEKNSKHLNYKPTTPNKAAEYFAFWRGAGTDRLRSLVHDIAAIIESREERRRKRKPEDAKTFARCVEALVCNLVYSATVLNAGSIAISLFAGHALWRAGRYTNHGIKYDTMRGCIAQAEGEFLKLTLGPLRGIASTIAPTPEFCAEVARRGITADDLARLQGAEPIVLLRNADVEGGKRAKVLKEFVDYRDTPTTREMRAEIDALNTRLEQAPIAFLPDGQEPRVNTAKRTLQRRFYQPQHLKTPCFDYHGRLYGGFWLNLEKARRRESLKLAGSRIAEVDLSACFLRLACALSGLPIETREDPYTMVIGAEPRLDGHRAGLKRAVSALLFSPGMRRWPQNVAQRLPHGFKVADMRRVLCSVFPGLVQWIERPDAEDVPIGFTLMRIEAGIVLRALGVLSGEGVVALPVHDALLVPEADAERVRDVLECAALEVAGVMVPAHVWRRCTETEGL